jgi:nucleoside phosphorylase
MKNIVIIMAMKDESEPIIKTLNLKKFNHSSLIVPIRIFHNNKLFLIVNGHSKKYDIDRVGTQAAAVSTYICCSELQPDLIISLGTCGATSHQNFQIGDIVIGTQHYLFHDRRIPLPKFDQYGLGLYPVYNHAENICHKFNLKSSVIASGNSLINTAEDLAVLQEYKAYVKEMEVASIAEVADDFNIPVLAIKAITDYYDQPSHSAQQFLQNFNLAVNNLSKSIDSIISYIQTL